MPVHGLFIFGLRRWAVPEPAPNVPELPEPSAELILLLALVQAHMRSLSRKERSRFMADVSNALGLQESAYNILRFRPRAEDRAVYRAMKQAAAWWRQSVSVVLRLEE
jgi:hypothetical protein